MKDPQQHAALDAAISALHLSIDSTFIPFSLSRNKAEKHRSLNWSVTLTKDQHPILTTDYSAGCAHCPSYVQGRLSVDDDKTITREVETGKSQKMPFRAILPETRDVLYSLVLDADVIDSSGFEDWAANYGYDTDSRWAEAIYRQCLELALKLRAGIGEDGLTKLREAFQDY